MRLNIEDSVLLTLQDIEHHFVTPKIQALKDCQLFVMEVND